MTQREIVRAHGHVVDANMYGLIEQRRKMSTWAVSRSFSEYKEELVQANQLIADFNNYKDQMQKRDFWKKIALLYDVERTFVEVGDSSGLCQTVISFFAENVQTAFRPCPSAEQICKFLDLFIELCDERFDLGGKTFSLKVCAEAKLYPKRSVSLHRLRAQKDAGEFDASLAVKSASSYNRSLADVREVLTEEKWKEMADHVVNRVQGDFMPQFGKYPILEWFMRSILLAASKGRITGLYFTDVFGSMKQKASSQERRLLMPWSVLGRGVEVVLGVGNTDPDSGMWLECDFAPMPMLSSIADRLIPDIDEELTSSVFPRFTYELTELKGVMEGKIALVEEMKTKILAAVFALGITLGQLLIKQLSEKVM